MLTLDDERLANMVKRITLDRPNSLAAIKLGRFVRPGSTELASIRSTAATQTAMLDTLRLLSSMETTSDAFDMAELGTSNVSLFIVLPLDKLTTHGRWLRLILTLAIRAISRQARRPPQPVLFMLDEMGTVGKLDVVENAVGLLAGHGIRIWGFLQDLSQLRNDYPRWETFIGNSSNIVLLGVGDMNTAEYFSKHMGSRTVSYLDTTYSGGRSGVQGNSGWSQGFQFHERPLMLPSEIMQKPTDSLLILRQGGPYMHLKKSIYHKEARWRGLYRDNPNFLPPDRLQRLPLQREPPLPPQPVPRPVRPQTKILRCTNCAQSLRVPIDRGAGWVTCPSCKNRWMFSGG
jgi:type IV secretion system protein VirD4